MSKIVLFIMLLIVLGGYTQEQLHFKSVTVNEGLSQNSVTSIAQDNHGFMWFATQDGLSQFNGLDFTIKEYAFEDRTRQDYFRLGKVYVDSKNNLWLTPENDVLTQESDGITKKFFEIARPSCIVEHEDIIYVGSYGDGIYTIQDKQVSKLNLDLNNEIVYQILSFSNHVLLICTNKRIYKYFIEENRLQPIGEEKLFSCILIAKNQAYAATFDGSIFQLKNDDLVPLNVSQFSGKLPIDIIVYDLEEDRNGRLWVGTFDQGIYVVDQQQKTIENIVSKKFSNRGLNYDYVLDIFKDSNDVIWVGTDGGGVSYYDENSNKFNVLLNRELKDAAVDLVISISVDIDGLIWMGTSGKGLTKYNPETENAETYSIIDDKRILSLLHDDDGSFWIGSFQGGLHLFKRNTVEKIQVYDSEEENSISIAWIKDVGKDSILFGTYHQGVFLYHKQRGVLRNHRTTNTSVMKTNLVTCAYQRSKHEFLLGMGNGDVLELNLETNQVEHVVSGEVFNHRRIKSLYANNQVVFVGTINGLFRIEKDNIRKFDRSNGLPNNVIYSIAPHKDELWISTNKGIARLTNLDQEQISVNSFTKDDDLQGNEFNTGAYFKDKHGQIYFGGIDGMNWFHPDKIKMNDAIPETRITNFLLTKDKQKAKARLSHKQNNLTIQFTSSIISLARKNQYNYRLLGLDKEWKSIGNQNSIDFIGLRPGKYEFQVIGSNYDGVWSKEPATLHFRILRPWYKSMYAYAIYAVLFIWLLYIIYSYQKKRLQAQNQIETLKYIDEAKSKMYAEISHELKTPLMLIQGNTNRLRKRLSLSQEESRALYATDQNTNQMLNLVNQMLDLVSIDAKQFELDYSNVDIVQVLRQSTELFESQAKIKEQTLHFETTIDELFMQIDVDNLQKIINNLLSNAIKFTSKEGIIKVVVSPLSKTKVQIQVTDTGQGIESQHLSRIFDRYYRTFDTDNNLGNGIGMALCKELVELMKGSINVRSTVGLGSIFTVTLPVVDNGKREVVERAAKKILGTSDQEEIIASEEPREYHLIILEDNHEMQVYYNRILSQKYKLTFFDNGVDALKELPNQSFDFILSDVVMPKMDGFEFCKQVKNDWKTSHIPLIFVSGKTTSIDRQKGYSFGADAYLPKPFEEEELQVIIINLLQKRKKNAEYYKKRINLEQKTSTEHQLSPNELDFIERLQTLIFAANGYSTDELAKELNMSRSQLHRKLKALTQLSTTQYINSIRIERAKELLISTDKTISEIAYEVGFTDSSYFGKIFKKLAETTPQQYRKDQNNNT